MKLADLSPELIERIKDVRYDAIREKHEGPWDWKDEFEWNPPEFMQIEGRSVLLPIDKDRHEKITILRTVMSNDSNTLVVFLKDITFVKYPDEPSVWSRAGYIAVCEKMSGAEFYIATVYHEWFIIDNPAL